MDLRKELGNKIDLFEKHGLVNELEDMFKNPELIELDIEDLKEVLKGEITGVIFKTTIDLNENFEYTKFNDLTPNQCVIKISSSTNLKLADIDLLISNIKESINPNLNIIFGVGIDDSLKDSFKIQAIFSYKE